MCDDHMIANKYAIFTLCLRYVNHHFYFHVCDCVEVRAKTCRKVYALVHYTVAQCCEPTRLWGMLSQQCELPFLDQILQVAKSAWQKSNINAKAILLGTRISDLCCVDIILRVRWNYVIAKKYSSAS